MKSILLSCLLCLLTHVALSQSPDYYYYDPPNAGVNNLYFNDVISYKFLFIFTQGEWTSVGVTGPVLITSIWLKSNTAYSLFIDDLRITMGHSTLAVPVSTFANNFDVISWKPIWNCWHIHSSCLGIVRPISNSILLSPAINQNTE